MLGDFMYFNPTKIYFGKKALHSLYDELQKYGDTIMLVYGGGTIKRTGLYDQVMHVLKTCQKHVIEDGGVMSNPTVEKLYTGCRIARENAVDFILAVGGGSVCDYAKAVSASAYCKVDPWEKYFIRHERTISHVIPVGCILTMTGTGSEMNSGAVITNESMKQKIGHTFDESVFPQFSILNPEWTYTLSHNQMVSGIFDIMSHLMEQYFSGQDDNTTDYIAEGMMRSLIQSSRVALKDYKDYEARSNIMWIATWALNTVLEKGKSMDWMVHNIGHVLGAYTDATHGMTLSAISIPYYQRICPDGLHKFKRFAMNVWGIQQMDKTDEQVAMQGIKCLQNWMKELGLIMDIRQLGISEEMLQKVAKNVIIVDGGYGHLTSNDIVKILRNSMEVDEFL